MTPWSWSHLNAYAQCPRKYHHYYVLRDVPWETTPEMDVGTRKHKEMENAIKAGALLAQFKPLAEVKLGITETGSACDFHAANCWGRGVVDVLVTHGDVAHIFDWKTGKVRDDPDEIATHAILVKQNYGSDKIYGRYVWLKENRIGVQHDLSNTGAKLERIRDTVDAIEHQLKMGYMPPKQSPLCGWCRVKSCQFNPGRTQS